ncbi:mitochondrial outer membrane protein porin 2-like [Populus nigra]|uniref:mitochondrial outer membrane protein porin 2-like n=1 Tax=Populus nigra TaxID=3691 RepID=UPI002B26953B|nr:mitochondrial outer membrane protein porin 2-like [Populus nigra]
MNSSDHQESARSKETGGPRLFSDFGKLAYDLLRYRINQSFNISTSSDIGLTLTPYAARRKKLSKAGVTAEYNLEDTHATIKVDVNPELPISTTLTMSRTWPFMKNTVLVKFPDYNSREFQILHEVQYFHKRAALAMTLPLLRSPLIQLTATVGTAHLAFGMETVYNTSSRQFLMFDAGISMTSLNCEGSIILENKGDSLRASYIHYFDHERKVAAVAVIGRTLSRKENAFAVGASWIMDDLTTIKARFDSHGKLVTVLHHKIKPKSYFTISGEFEPKALDKTPEIRLGLSLVL